MERDFIRPNILVWGIPPACSQYPRISNCLFLFWYKLVFGLKDSRRTHRQDVDKYESFYLYSLFDPLNALHNLVMAQNWASKMQINFHYPIHSYYLNCKRLCRTLACSSQFFDWHPDGENFVIKARIWTGLEQGHSAWLLNDLRAISVTWHEILFPLSRLTDILLSSWKKKSFHM